MGLSLNPFDIIKIFRDRGIRSHERIADYLDVIATVATSLANAWSGILESSMRREESKVPLSHILQSQIPWFYEASEHYKRASTALGGKLGDSELKELFLALGTILETRNDTKRLYRLLDEDSAPRRHARKELRMKGSVTRNQIEKNIDVMHREAATLRAIAAAVRAQH